jgi:hypothetical protein
MQRHIPFLVSTAKSKRNGGLSWKCIRALPCLICPWRLCWIKSLFFLAIGVFMIRHTATPWLWPTTEVGLYGSPLQWSYKDLATSPQSQHGSRICGSWCSYSRWTFLFEMRILCTGFENMTKHSWSFLSRLSGEGHGGTEYRLTVL